MVRAQDHVRSGRGTGEVRWQYSPDIPKGIDQYACCDVNNRGVSYADERSLSAGSMAKRAAALDAKTRKGLVVTKIVDYTQGSVITFAPDTGQESRDHRLRWWWSTARVALWWHWTRPPAKEVWRMVHHAAAG